MADDSAKSPAESIGYVQVGEWFGHPRGLTVLVLTAMWEQFSYYGMRALLVYYMTKQLLLGQRRASLIYGAYTAFVYLTPIIGGVLADRWVGRRRSVITGGCVMAVGHVLMTSEPLFYLALVTIGIGNGLFLPSLPSQIRGLYSDGDPRGRAAYIYYYIGVNLGAFLAPLAIGTIGEFFGWHWGFGLAGIGMGVGVAIYLTGRRWLPVGDGQMVRAACTRGAEDLRLGSSAMRRLGLLGLIACVAVVFRAAYEQVGNSLPLWIDQTG